MDNVIQFHYLDLDPTNVWFINGIMVLFQYYIFIFIFKTFKVRPQISWLTTIRKEFDMLRFCYLCVIIRRDTEGGKCIENASNKELKSVFGRNLYDTDVTNSIFEIRLTFYCIFLYTYFQPTAWHEWLEGEQMNSCTLS